MDDAKLAVVMNLPESYVRKIRGTAQEKMARLMAVPFYQDIPIVDMGDFLEYLTLRIEALEHEVLRLKS